MDCPVLELQASEWAAQCSNLPIFREKTTHDDGHSRFESASVLQGSITEALLLILQITKPDVMSQSSTTSTSEPAKQPQGLCILGALVPRSRSM
jgi:hypothetical protein